MRRALHLGQDHIARHLDVSVSEISRLERGLRSLRVDQLDPWAKSLGFRAEIVMWVDPAGEGSGVDEDSLKVLEEVAASLPHLPPRAREALINQMQIWRRGDS